MKKRILIIGIQGFLGNALRLFLKKRYPQHQLYGISRRISHPNSRNISCDLNHTQKLKRILAQIDPDYIFNLSGGRLEDQKHLLSSNFFATISLLNAVEELDYIHPRIIIPGTAAEYGIPDTHTKKINERFMPDPVSWYGYIKYLQTSVSVMYAQKGLDVVVARMFNISGVGVPPNLAMGRFCQEIAAIEAKKKKPVISTKNLDGKRDFLDINDVCSALWQLARYGKRGEIYNICSGRSYTIRKLLKDLLKFSLVSKIAVHEDKHMSSGSCDIVGSNAKIKGAMCWNSTVDMKRSLKETLAFYRRRIVKA